jgi:hypothetical protein
VKSTKGKADIMQGIYVKILLLIFLLMFSASCRNDLTPKQKALDLAKKTVMEDGLSAENHIKKMIEDGGNDIKPQGWDIEKIEDQIFIVKYKYKIYSFEKGIGEQGYFFQVDLKKNEVVDVTDQYLQRMAPLSKPFKNEEEIDKSLFKNSDEM